MMDPVKLRALIEDDDLGLLEIKPRRDEETNPKERLVESFFEITAFFDTHGREPSPQAAAMEESRLGLRLSGLREDPEKVTLLLDFDQHGLLSSPELPEAPSSVDAIIEDDDLGLLRDDSGADIFDLRHVHRGTVMPDYIAQRESCPDFTEFEPLFQECHRDLRSGKRCLRPFSREQQIEAGQFFVLKGVMGYVASVGDREKIGGKYNARLRCIFENGTESNMLLRSLAAELYKNGRRVSEHEKSWSQGLGEITPEDEQSGTIYILRSMSDHPSVSGLKHLYKVGFSRGPVEERIKNAEEDPTYLMAPVRVLETFDCYNLNPQKLELLLHRFFANACLEIDVFDQSGKRHTPREWFVAPLSVIEEAIHLVINGSIVDFAYDPQTETIRLRGESPDPPS